MADDRKKSTRDALTRLHERRAAGAETQRSEALVKRREKGWRSARQNLDDLVDADTFQEFGDLAIAAQRGRRSVDDLVKNTSGDGVITGIGRVNSQRVGTTAAATAIVVNDYSVLAGTQGFYHHKKIDRILEIAARDQRPVVMLTEGGGGRPGDTDVTTQVTGLDVPTFARWAKLAERVPRIAVANGYCFAGNALLFGSADIRIATQTSWIGMAGPAMIEAGGVGTFAPTDIGPIEQHEQQGTVELVAENEESAIRLARDVLSYFQGSVAEIDFADQTTLRDVLPADRRYTYKLRPIIERLVDRDTFLELRPASGTSVVVGFCRIGGQPLGLIANDNQQIAGAIDAAAAAKAAWFLKLCDAHQLPLVSLIDTPGFMVGPDSESQGAVGPMSDMFLAASGLSTPMLAIVLRKAYGLGAMAMAGGGFSEPHCSAAWPTGEFGAMGLEGAVRLGFKKELEAIEDSAERSARYDALVQQMYERGSAIEVASMLEIDQVIDPAATRDLIASFI